MAEKEKEKEKEKVLTSLADVQVGMRLEAMDKYGKWYVAKVIEVDEDDGDVLVHFEGWSSRYDEYVEVRGGRLRTLSSSKLTALLKEKKSKKNLNIGDRVQAKWEDGRMYFGKVLMIRGDNVEVQFDDGVYYTAPLSHVRKRNMDKSQGVIEDYLREPSVAAAIEARKRRAEKRQRSDDSASQTSVSSPPSSPIFMPKKSKPLQCISDDSTETESDFDDERRVRIREKPVSTQTKTTDSTAAASSKGGSISSSPISSDSEQPRPPSSRKKKYDALREPYKLRGVVQMPRLSPVDEDPTASISTSCGAQVDSAFLTPPFESQSLVKPTQQPLLSSSGPSPKPSLGSTPPETPKLSSHSQKSVKSASALTSGRSAEEAHASVHEGGRASKRVVSDSAAPSPSKLTQAGSPAVSKKQPSVSTATSSSSSSVATRTRAQTKFGVVVKKSEKKPAKLAPKELVIMWDHNEHKCQFTGCSKSFRKESLLLSHIKHYHHVKPKTPPAKGKGAATTKSDSKSPLSPKSPRMSPKTPVRASPKSRSPKSRALQSPKSPSLKSILSPPKPREEAAHVSFKTDPLRRSKSPTESFFESMEKQQRSVEVLKLLEQSAKEQAAALSQKSPLPGVSPPAEIAAGPTALRFHLQESSITGGPKTTTRTQEAASAQPSVLEAQKPKPKSSSKPSASGSKKLKHVSLSGLTSVTPRKVPLVEIKALPKEILPPSPTKKLQSPGKATFSPTQSQKSESGTMPIGKETGVLQLEGGEGLDEEVEGGRDEDAKSLSMESEGNEDDVVHCVCGSEVDEGFMIQCEQCLCWQHGDCIGITKETLPEKYICYICINPPGLRTRLKHRFDRDWFAEGALPSLPGGPKFTETAAIHLSHQLADSLYKLRKMIHSAKVKLQAASNPNHPYLKQWAKECAHLSQDDIMSYLITALQPVSYDSEGSKDPSAHPTTSRTDGSAGVKDAQESRNENSSKENANSDVALPTEKLSLSSPIDIAALHLEPLPHSCSVTPTPPPPVSSSFSSPPSLTTTIESSSFDPKSLKLAPLPPLSVEDLQNMTAVILKSSLLQSTPTVIQATHLTSGSTTSESVPTSASFEPLPELSLTENPIPSSEKPALDLDDTKDSFGSSLEMNEEFGVQEMSVFAVDDASAHHSAIEPKTKETEMPVFAVDANTCSSEIKLKPRETEQDLTKSTPVSSHLSHSITTSVPISIPSPSKLVSSSRSAFKPVIIPLTTSSASNHLTSLLASQRASISNGRSPTISGLKLTSTSTSLDHRQQSKAESNPNSLQTLSSAKSTMDTVTLGEFAEAFMHGDTTKWVNRMLLFDHVEAVQNKVTAWMELIEKQLEEIPCDDNSLEDMTTLLMDVQAVVRQLGQIRQIASSCQVEA